MRTHLLSTIVLMTILTVACGGRASSPISPSGVAPSVSASGNAVVAGNVRLGATAGVGSASDPMKVQVVRTDIVATVSLAGQFVLNGVPSGQIQLHFFGAGVNATVTIGQIATGETVTISVTVVGTTAVVESEARKAPDQAEEQIEGRIESLPPTQAAGAFVVAGRTVTTTATTVFTMGSVTTTFAESGRPVSSLQALNASWTRRRSAFADGFFLTTFAWTSAFTTSSVRMKVSLPAMRRK